MLNATVLLPFKKHRTFNCLTAKIKPEIQIRVRAQVGGRVDGGPTWDV